MAGERKDRWVEPSSLTRWWRNDEDNLLSKMRAIARVLAQGESKKKKGAK
jgi:hypothetical protein